MDIGKEENMITFHIPRKFSSIPLSRSSPTSQHVVRIVIEKTYTRKDRQRTHAFISCLAFRISNILYKRLTTLWPHLILFFFFLFITIHENILKYLYFSTKVSQRKFEIWLPIGVFVVIHFRFKYPLFLYTFLLKNIL